VNPRIPLAAIPVEHLGHDREALCLSLLILAREAPDWFDLLVDAVVAQIPVITTTKQESHAA
jgi:hypothetical protein